MVWATARVGPSKCSVAPPKRESTAAAPDEAVLISSRARNKMAEEHRPGVVLKGHRRHKGPEHGRTARKRFVQLPMVGFGHRATPVLLQIVLPRPRLEGPRQFEVFWVELEHVCVSGSPTGLGDCVLSGGSKCL